MEFLLQPETYISLITLTFLEIVLGIDNIIFISIITDRLPEENQKRIRTIGLLLALVMRITLLSLITVIIQLKEPLFTISEFEFSVRDVVAAAVGAVGAERLDFIAVILERVYEFLAPGVHREFALLEVRPLPVQLGALGQQGLQPGRVRAVVVDRGMDVAQ